MGADCEAGGAGEGDGFEARIIASTSSKLIILRVTVDNEG